MKQELFKHKSETLIVKRLEDHSTLVIRVCPEGVFLGKLWKFAAYLDNTERMRSIHASEYKAKLRGYEVYVTLDNYAGINGLTDIYDPQQVVNAMAEYVYMNEVSQNAHKYKGSRTE